jgi:hypothetical protein
VTGHWGETDFVLFEVIPLAAESSLESMSIFSVECFEACCLTTWCMRGQAESRRVAVCSKMGSLLFQEVIVERLYASHSKRSISFG